jgi:hypothetical protein
MFTFLRNLIVAKPSTPRPCSRRRRLGLEALEDRLALTATQVGSLPLFDAQGGEMGERLLARSDFGTIAQLSQDSTGALRVRVFNTQGHLLGNSTVPGTGMNDYQATIGMSVTGDFVVAWTHTFSRSPYDIDVRAQQFSASGSPVGPTIWVAASWNWEDEPSVGMDAIGNFAVAYRFSAAAGNHDIFVRTFDRNGAPTHLFPISTTTQDESSPSLAMNRWGTWAVAYTYDWAGPDLDIHSATFDSTGRALDSASGWVAWSSLPEAAPSVGIDNAGDFAVAYTLGSAGSTTVQVQRMSVSGQTLGKPIPVPSDGAPGSQPSLGMAADGRFAVAWLYKTDGFGFISVIQVQEFNMTGAVLGVATIVNGAGGTDRTTFVSTPTLAMNSIGDFGVDYFASFTGDVVERDAFLYRF